VLSSFLSLCLHAVDRNGKFNKMSEEAEVAQTKLQSMSALQDLCRGLEERARKAEEERNAAALDCEAKKKLLSDMEKDVEQLRVSAAAASAVRAVTPEIETKRADDAALLGELESLRAACASLQERDQENEKKLALLQSALDAKTASLAEVEKWRRLTRESERQDMAAMGEEMMQMKDELRVAAEARLQAESKAQKFQAQLETVQRAAQEELSRIRAQLEEVRRIGFPSFLLSCWCRVLLARRHLQRPKTAPRLRRRLRKVSWPFLITSLITIVTFVSSQKLLNPTGKRRCCHNTKVLVPSDHSLS
jgi:hypothetical protein